MTQRPYDVEVREHREALYATHVAVNGASTATLEWLLAVRGGLPATSAFPGDIDEAAQRERIVMLTRCWFVPEVGGAAPAIVPTPARLEEILRADGLSDDQCAQWLSIGEPLLGVPIRDDAHWVDRRAAYDAAKQQLALSHEAVDDILFSSGLFSRETFLSFSVKRATSCIQAARGWLSKRLGSGTGADFARLASIYRAIAAAAQDDRSDAVSIARACGCADDGQLTAFERLLASLSAAGHKSRTKNALVALRAGTLDAERRAALADTAKADAAACDAKPHKRAQPWSTAWAALVERAYGLPFRGERDHLSEYAVAIDLAARRLSSQHAWTGRAEAERVANAAARREAEAAIPPAALAWLDAYRRTRAEDLGSASITVDERSIAGWPEICAVWGTCTTAAERIEQLRALQGELRPFGDRTLFVALAGDDAAPVRECTDALPQFAALPAADGLAPAIRHIDPHTSPVWLEYGTSRWALRHHDRMLTLATLVDGTLATATVKPRSRRLERDLLTPPASATPSVSRADSLGRLSAGDALTVPETSIDNGRLTTNRNALAHLARLPDEQRRAAAARLPWRLTFSASLPQRPLDPRLVERLRALKGTTGKGRPGLSNIPGLRVLAVDLGLRHGAACAVLETINPQEATALARAGTVALQPAATYALLPDPARNGRPIRLRRIAGDDAAAPWARVEQTWTIRLPGERAAERRAAAPWEVSWLSDLAGQLGAPVNASGESLTALRNGVVAVARALRANGELVRLATRLRDPASDPRQRPADAVRLEALERLATRADGTLARAQEERLLYRQTSGSIDPRSTAGRPSKGSEEIGNALDPRAAAADPARCAALAAALEVMWKRRDEAMRRALRTLRRVLRPSGAEARQRGGLSLERIDLVDRAYRLQRAMLARPTPEEPRGRRPAPQQAQRLRTLRQTLATERIRLLAHGIVAAALGGERSGTLTAGARAVHTPCSVIVVEDLSTLRTTRAQVRSRNRQISVLAPAEIERIVRDVCALHGLLLYTVPAAYTSLRHGITGAPGMLAEQVSVNAFLFSSRWQRERDRARRSTSPRATLLRALFSRWDDATGTWLDERGRAWRWDGSRWRGHGSSAAPSALLVPIELGPLFVDETGREVDGDQNAAVNIALAAITDPMWPGVWWSVLCRPDGRVDAAVAKLPGVPRGTLLDAPGRPTRAWRDDPTGAWLPTRAYWDDVEARVCGALMRRYAFSTRASA